MLTGTRKAEAGEAQWPEFDLRERLWTIPRARLKSDSTHLVPLSDAAIAVLSSLPEWTRGGSYLFSATGGQRPVNGFAFAKEKIDRLVGEQLGQPIEPWVFHDIRRTVRTRLSGLRVPEPIAEMTIGHARKGLLRTYDTHRHLEEIREALDLWANALRDITTPPPENVVKMKARAS
jgi:integrase